MKSHEVLREAAEQVGVKALASELRLSPALIYKWCEENEPGDPDASGTRNPLDRVREIVRFTGHIPVVSWLCQESGGFFVYNPQAGAGPLSKDLLQGTQRLVMAFSSLLNEVSRSVENDGAIDPAEAVRIRDGWEKLKTMAETFVVACERGVYHGKTGR